MKRFLVVGLKKSGVSSANLLIKEGQVFLYDDDVEAYSSESVKTLISKGCIKVEKRNLERVILAIDTLVISPSVPLNSCIARLCKNLDKEVIGEIELGSKHCKGLIIAVTGTNGKTTTTTLIDYILNLSGKTCYLLGNVGAAFCSKCAEIKEEDFVALEVSSFQLESVVDFKPKIAALLNLTVDHLNRHKTFEQYCYAKTRIFKNQDYSDYAILNADSKIVLDLTMGISSRKYFISQKKKVIGSFCLDNELRFFDGEKEEFIADTNEVNLKGKHNIENMLVAITVAKILDIDNATIKHALSSFCGVEHRLENCGEKDGITFINDSKATNINSTLPALDCFKDKVALILGGSDKGYEFDELFVNYPTNIVLTVVIGETTNKIISAMKRANLSNFVTAKTLEDAVLISARALDGKGTVLLSPACASFDMFENFERRGDAFKTIVEKIIKN